MVDLEQAIVALIEWANDAAKKGNVFRDFWVTEYPIHWSFSPCGSHGEILDVSRSISISKETGKASLYFPPDHPEDFEKGERVGSKPIHIDLNK